MIGGDRWRPSRRDRSELTFVGATPPATPLLPDTNVYIGMLAKRTVPSLARVMTAGPDVYVAAPTLAELTWIKGRLMPDHSNTRRVLADLDALLATFDPSRIVTPHADEWAAAGEIGGQLARALAGGGKKIATAFDRNELVNDVLIALVARREDLPVLTEDRHFDLLAQLIPGLQILFYDRTAPG